MIIIDVIQPATPFLIDENDDQQCLIDLIFENLVLHISSTLCRQLKRNIC